MSEKQKARIAVLLANFFFGTTIIAVKHISPLLLTPLALTSIRVTVCTFLFWGLFALKPEKMLFTKKDFLNTVTFKGRAFVLNNFVPDNFFDVHTDKLYQPFGQLKLIAMGTLLSIVPFVFRPLHRKQIVS